ncbi:hypothetical protein [Sinisalibacter aestuarii]|uniref:Uncharacterized protein n=1 Tax=Sinisalibacter aestuarii TaxID=2949426 RepID=A0ABQ5LP55_9RHOB|nr:hypothetical protein [Sinisalibacter aestuarii]GKY86753.1 hypothetical protein STA1M1_06220 [Sinisalibacter aestuarii]
MVAPRLHIMTATASDYAVILRRGPTQQVASIGWHRASDSFELGQWLHGRIYEHRADLSPDGRHMIYFAGKGGVREGRAPWWTAISRAPYLHAIAFLPQDSTWGGGGAFTEQGEVFLNGGGPLPNDADGLVPAANTAMPHSTDGFHMGGLYAAAMQRRGWQADSVPGYGAGLWRELAGGWRIELRFETQAANRSIVANRYALVLPGKARVDHPDWEWADIWQDGLHFAAQGGLHFARIGPDGQLHDHRPIRNFSDMSFERIRAPYDDRNKGDHR